jgi:hypothetical protein
MQFTLNLSIVLLMLSISTACKKGEGQGGKYTITGKVYENKFDINWNVNIGSYYSQSETVYIIYGDDVTYGDNQKTNYDGSYEFKFLRKGKYKIYVYSDTTNTYATANHSSTLLVKILDATLGSEKKVILPDFVIFHN